MEDAPACALVRVNAKLLQLFELRGIQPSVLAVEVLSDAAQRAGGVEVDLHPAHWNEAAPLASIGARLRWFRGALLIEMFWADEDVIDAESVQDSIKLCVKKGKTKEGYRVPDAVCKAIIACLEPD